MKQLFFRILILSTFFISCSKNNTDISPSNPSGTDTTGLDTSASMHGKWVIDNSFHTADTFISCAVKLPDGEIILATHNTVRKINTDGTDDGSFSPKTVSGGEINCMTIQSDGKLLVGGNFNAVGASAIPALARLNPDGSVDNSFIIDFSSGSTVNAIAIQTTGDIVIGGRFGCDYQGVAYSRNNLARLNSTGTVDESFINHYVAGSYGTSNAGILGITMREDNSFYVTGYTLGLYNTAINRQEDYIGLLDINGNMNTNFITDQVLYSGTPLFPYVGIFTVQESASGTVLIGGSFSSVLYQGAPTYTYHGPLLWLNSAGSTNRAITHNIHNGLVRSIVTLDDNKIFIGGGLPACALINNSGQTDSSYNLTYPTGLGTELVKENSNSILVTGRLTMSSTQSTTVGIIRIKSN